MGFFLHESSYLDDDVTIGEGTKIWYFCHIQKGARIGKNCILGQNVNVGNNVVIGNHVKIQNNVSVYEGVTLEDCAAIARRCSFRCRRRLVPHALTAPCSRRKPPTSFVITRAAIG